MKRLAALFCSFLMSLLFCCACSSDSMLSTSTDSAPDKVFSESSGDTSTTEYTLEKDRTVECKQVLNDSTENFRMVSTTDLTAYGSGNEQGFYQIFLNDDNSKNILYVDYATHQQVYLCSQPNCEHDSESCTSWIPPEMGQVNVVTLPDRILLIHNNMTEITYIEQLNLDGSDKEILYKFEGSVDIANGVAYNGKYIVFKLETYTRDSADNFTNVPSLGAISLEKKEFIPLLSLKPGNHASNGQALFLFGTSKTGFILKTISVREDLLAATVGEDSGENPALAMAHTMYELPFNGDSTREIFSYLQDECRADIYGGDLFLLCENGNSGVMLQMIPDCRGEPQTIVDDFESAAGDLITGITTTTIFPRARVDDYLLFNFESSSGIKENGDIEVIFKRVQVDLKSGMVKENTLSNYYNATNVPVEILGEAGEQLLVQASVNNVASTGKIAGVERSLGLISKNDFLASRPNYTRITEQRKAA